MLFWQKKSQLFFLSILLLAAFFVVEIKKVEAAFDPAITYSKTNNGQLSADEWNNLQNDFVRTWGSTTAVGGIGIGIAPQGTDINGLVASSTIKTNTSFLGALSAAYVTPGAFNSIAGTGGNFSFPASVGIGATPVNAGLHLSGADTYSAMFRLVNSSASGGQYFMGVTNSAWDAGGNKLVFGAGTPSSANIKMVLAANGNVGIGTTNPNQQLEITKNFRLPATVGTNAYGVIYKNGNRFIHDFNYGLNGNGITTDGRNTFVGLNAGNLTMGSTATSVEQASYNTGIGVYSLYSNTTGHSNTANGYASLYLNTTGYRNTANGYASLRSNTTGNYNTANGYYSLYSNTTGYNNTANGSYSLYSNTTGYNNTALGRDAGRFIVNGSTGWSTGNNGLYLGYNSRASADGTNNEIVIGANAIGKGSSTATYGNSSMVKHIFEAGNVGIGTTTPQYKLDVAGEGNFNGNYIHGVRGPVLGTDAANRSYVDTLMASTSAGIITQIATSSLWQGSLTGAIYNNNTGNVGIGTTNPTLGKLMINANADSSWLYLQNASESGFYTRIYNDGTGAGSTVPFTRIAMGHTGFGDNASINFYRGGGGAGGFLTFTTNTDIERMRIDNTGNVGIGTTTPNAVLDVFGNAKITNAGLIYNTDSSRWLDMTGTNIDSLRVPGDLYSTAGVLKADGAGNSYVMGKLGVRTSNPGGNLSVDVGSSSNMGVNGLLVEESGAKVASIGDSGASGSQYGYLGLYSTGDVERVRLYAYGNNWIAPSNGNVGIGTTNPGTYKLNVSGKIYVEGADRDTTGAGRLIYTWKGLELHANHGHTGESAALDFTNNNGYLSRIVGYGAGTGNGGHLLFFTSPDHTYAGMLERMVITNSGNVGIGNTAPGYKLDVAGEANFNGNQIHGVAAPVQGTDAANKSYVDSSITPPATTTAGIQAGFWTTGAGGSIYNNNSSGLVGIGTTNPGSKLTVSGPNDKDTGPILNLSGSSVNQLESGRVRFTETTVAAAPFYQGAFFHYDGSANTFNIGVHETADALQASDINSIRITRSNGSVNIGNGALFTQYNGNVGVGINNPDYPLTIKYSANGQIGLRRSDGNTVGLLGVDSSNVFNIQSTSGSGNIAIKQNVGGSGQLTTLFLKGSNGNVGIGTTAPTQKLHVAGDASFLVGTSSPSQVHDVAAPTQGTDVANRNYVDTNFAPIAIVGSASLWATSSAGTYNVGLGNVGIGTTNPVSKLNIVSNAGDAHVTLSNINSATSSYVTYSLQNIAQQWQIGLHGDTSQLRIRNATNSTYPFVINTNGNVGIGTTNPTGKFVIKQSGGNWTDGLNIERSATTDKFNFTHDTAGRLLVGYNSVKALGIFSSGISVGSYAATTPPSDGMIIPGNVGIATTTPQVTLDVNGLIKMRASNITTTSDVINKGYLDSALEAYGSSNNFWKLNGSNLYASSTAWNVGIGVTNPTQKLDVAGNILANNHYAPTIEGFKMNGSLSNVVITTDTTQVAQTPIAGFLWHDILAFNRTGTPTFETSVDGTTWSSAPLDNRLFSQREAQSITILDASVTKAVRWTWSSGISCSLAQWLVLAYAYSSPAINQTVSIDTSTDGSTWSNKHLSTFNGTFRPYWLSLNPPEACDGNFFRVTITSNSSTGLMNMSSMRLLTSRWGNQGGGSEYSYPYNWDSDRNVFFDRKVGIGTTNPLNRLTISADSDGDGLIIKRNSAGAGTYADLGFTMTTTDIAPATYLRAYRRTSYSDNDLLFHVGASDAMYIKSNGNVGIGTTSPQVTLDVNGLIKMRASNITTTSDVINKGYLDSALEAYGSSNNFWKLNGSNLYSSSTAWNVGIGTASPNEQLEITKNFRLPATSGTTPYGIIYKNGNSFIHDFNYGLNGNGITTTGRNTFVGLNAGNLTMGSTATSASEASYNTGIGSYSLSSNTTGYRNTANGYASLYSNTTGASNTANGYYSLYSNTTGSNNTANGYQSLYSNTTGNYNSVVGYASAQDNTIGMGNSVLGYRSLQANTTGSYNTAMGYNAGRYLANGSTGRSTGNNGLYLGYNSIASADGTTNEIVIGYNAIGKGSNTATYGNSSMLKHIFEAGNVGIGTTSPQVTLDVNGLIKMRASNITTTSDVINKGYLDSALETLTASTTALNYWAANGTNIYNKNTGNVGIGTTAPTAKTEIVGSASNPSLTHNATSILNLNRGESGATEVAFTIMGAAPYTASIQHRHSLSDNSSYPLALNPLGGNVGIGTTNPITPLNVIGKWQYNNAGAIYSQDNSYSLDLAGINVDSLKVYKDIYSTSGVLKTAGTGNNWMMGNLGVGTTAPTSKLELKDIGPVITLNDNRNLAPWVGTELLGGLDIYTSDSSTTGGRTGVGVIGGIRSYNVSNNNVPAADLRFYTSLYTEMATERMRIANNGNVGIGTTAPETKLHVNAGTVNSNILILDNPSSRDLVISSYKSGAYDDGGSKFLKNSSIGEFKFSNTVLDLMTLKADGNVGIGTTTPSTKLYVNGVVTATGGFSGPLTGTVNAANISKGIFGVNTGQGTYSFGGVTANGDSHYQWEGATYRNPGDYTPQINIRQDNATTGINGFKPALSLYNQNGDLNSTIGLDFSVRETTASGNATALAGIMAIKESAGTSGAWTQGGLLFYTKNFGERIDALRILNNGNVGIGVDPGAFKLKVAGNVAITGTLQTMTGSDFAEEFTVSSPLEAGTVVVMGDLGYKSVKACNEKFDSTVVGVVSDNPSIIAGRVDSKHKVVVAMAGVVKVKVSAINGKIKKGTMLTTSNISGYAMKADSAHPGTIIGKALENLSGQQGEIKVLINLQ